MRKSTGRPHLRTSLATLLILGIALAQAQPQPITGSGRAGSNGVGTSENGKSDGERIGGGVMKLLTGLLLIPLGLGVAAANSIEKCVEDDGGIMRPMNVICSDSGPSGGGQALGFGMALGGLVLSAAGLGDLSSGHADP